ncbi:MAG: VOC family protein [Tannerellaceae bacterium]|nr:VOC family protein [Tannerellaceae bacterium]
MQRMVSFFEIPAVDFNRAVQFYEQIFQVKLQVMECEQEKMAFFPEEDGQCPGAISWTADNSFQPGSHGVLLHLSCKDMQATLETITKNGGTVVTPKTKIEAEGRGYFALFTDSEGNRLGLYSDR